MSSFLIQTSSRLRQALARVREAVETHPGRVAAGVGGVLLLSSVSAFALVEYGPQPQLPAPSLVQQAVHIDLSSQVQALENAPRVLYSTAYVEGSDSAASLLRRLQVTDPAQLRVLAHDRNLQELLRHRGTMVSAEVDSLGTLKSLQAALPGPAAHARHAGTGSGEVAWRELSIRARADGGFDDQLRLQQAQAQTRVASAVVRSTLFGAADAAGVPDEVASQLAGLFGGEVDFRRDLRPGDHFTVAWRVYTAGNRVVRVGRILAAQVSVGGHDHSAVWFDPSGHPQAAAYYAPDGSSLSRAFLLSPLPYDRLTSGYGWRISPIFHKPEFHKGIDLAIPVGTPVRTIADGRVVYAGWGTGYGKYVKVDHPGGFATIYSHLSRFEVHVGEQVKQGEVVALSGNTGWSTGPHLYFQFFVHGKPVNPLSIASYTPKGTHLPDGLRAQFLASTAPRTRLLALMPQESDVAEAGSPAPKA
jgi:murein DD-endopeptidase MepM/ murein hydrolase activator NlpD